MLGDDLGRGITHSARIASRINAPVTHQGAHPFGQRLFNMGFHDAFPRIQHMLR